MSKQTRTDKVFKGIFIFIGIGMLSSFFIDAAKEKSGVKITSNSETKSASKIKQSDTTGCTERVGVLRSGSPYVPVFKTEKFLDEYSHLVAKEDQLGFVTMCREGKVYMDVKKDTPVRFLSGSGLFGSSEVEVRILEGTHRGASGWVFSEWYQCKD